MSILNEKATAAQSLASGLAAFSWQTPRPGKLFLSNERAGRGHSHHDRGGFILETGGKLLLPDPGTTNYSNARHYLMKDADWHNLAHPPDLPMLGETAVGAGEPLAELVPEGEWACRFRMNLRHAYGPEVREASREGSLRLDPEAGTGELLLVDAWAFDRPRVLALTFQSYLPWEVRRNGGVDADTGDALRLETRLREGGELEAAVLTDRNDWLFRKIETLKMTTAPALAAVLESRLRFRL